MKYLKRAMLFILILLICLTISWAIIKKYYLTDMVHARIEKSIGEQIENDFQFTFDDFKINLISGKAKLNGVNLLLFNQVDTVGYFKGDILIEVKSWRNIIFDDEKLIRNIVLKEAEFYYAKDYPLITKNKNGKDNQQVEISNVSVTGKLHLADKHTEQSGQLTTNFDLNTALNYNSKHEFSVDKIIKQVTTFEVSKFHYYLPDGFHQLTITEIAFTKFDNIALTQVTINPIDSKKTFSLKKKIASDFVSASIDSIQLIGFDRQIDEHIFIDQIELFQPNIDVFKDKNYPENKEYKAIMVDLLREFKTPVYIRTVEFNSMFIKYTEFVNQAKEAGALFFSEANATISNITNVKDSLLLSRNMLIEAEAKFYGKGILKTSMRYDMLSSSGQFGVKGSLGPMDMTTINAMLSKLMPVKIKSGQLDNLRFSFSGTSTHSEGEMQFEYTELNIELLEVDYWDSRFTRNIMSSIGNRLMRNSNPSNNGVFKIGEIKQDRNTTKSIFNYWWINLKSGFLSTLGVTVEKQKIKY